MPENKRLTQRAPRARGPVLALLGGLISLPCHAALSDTFQPYVSAAYAYDDNLLRLPENSVYGPVQSDTIRSVIAGLSFERPVGRQVFSGSVQASKVSFNHFSQLDYTGKDASLQWQWQLGNRLSGTAGASYSETLVPFTDYHSADQNLRTRRGDYVSGAWRFLSDWQVRGRYSKDRFSYDLQSQRSLDRDETNGVIGVDYLGSNGSSVGLQFTRQKGDYPHPVVLLGYSFDPSYTQDQVQLKVLWNLGATQLEFLGGHARRSHQVLAERDASGSNGRATANWAALGALSFNASLWREFSAFEGGTVSYSLNKGASVGATWVPTAKIKTELKYRHERREFPGLVSGASVLDGSDLTRGAVASVQYSPRNNMQLTLSATHDTRSATSGISSAYRANGASLSATVQF
ncbi:hypothetical protein GJ699_23790 [Duganella sp. FT80W]|uniref:Exopolysaccharide biosynthesis operon protein EpsL n=1 Tax=Duganella guangzhouensis TaxID=2666084 RepID=A0A6I2L3X1_9BURK|nr:XrtB/PEP-CTERM-associated polysaccharide biosynthesis outer membrane protein EpsL [Duganella guangzhouensis]MRW93025.1 hypothetical protein [Duganella guangzhouensis]